MARTVGLVIPAFRPNVETLRAYVLELCDRLEPATIRIELDDPSAETVAQLESVPATVNAVDARRGKGAAITAGFRALETDVYAFADADGSTSVDSVAAVVDRVREHRHGAALAVGSRRHPRSAVVSTQSAVRERFGDAFAWLARRLLSVPISDYQCGAKAIDGDVWAAVADHLREPGFAWDVELIALVDALGYRIEEVPVTWADAPETTVSSVATPLELTRGVVCARHRAKRLRGDRFHTAIARWTRGSPTVLESLEALESATDREYVSDTDRTDTDTDD